MIRVVAVAAIIAIFGGSPAFAERSKLIYGSYVDSLDGPRDLAVEAWSYGNSGAGITLYEIPRQPKVGTACIIERQYNLGKPITEFTVESDYTYCDGYISDSIIAISTTSFR